MAASANSVATLDARSYLERALAHGFAHGVLAEAHRARMQEEGAKALAKAGTVAVLLPGAFYALREKQAPPMQALRED